MGIKNSSKINNNNNNEQKHRMRFHFNRYYYYYFLVLFPYTMLSVTKMSESMCTASILSYIAHNLSN